MPRELRAKITKTRHFRQLSPQLIILIPCRMNAPFSSYRAGGSQSGERYIDILLHDEAPCFA